MSQGKSYEKGGGFVAVLLIIAIIAGGVVLGLKQWDGGKPIEISLASTPTSTLEIYLSGAVANEGIYSFSQDSSLEDVLQRAGGVTEDADLTSIKIYAPTISESSLIQPQKININRAEAWLLEALPEIGPTLAQRIIDYRNEKGLFHTIDELVNVSGISSKTLEKIDRKSVV